MASPFGMQTPAGGGAAASPLDGPPPSPTPMGGGSPFAMGGLAGGPPQIPAGQMPPEVLTGITQAAQTISSQLDSFAQVTPDMATQLALIKELLSQYLAGIMTKGAGPISPTAPGAAAPMGGIDKGISGPGSV